MDSSANQVISKPADGTYAMLPEDLVVLNPSNGRGISQKRRLPVIGLRDDHSDVGGPESSTKMGSHNDPLTELPAQERSVPNIYTLTSDTESEGCVIQPPDTSRTARKMLESTEYYPTPDPLHAQHLNTENRKRVVVETYSSAGSVVTDSEADDDNYTASRIKCLQDKIQDLEDKRKQRQLRAAQKPQMEPSRYHILYRLGYEVRPDVRGTSSDEYSSDSDSDEPYRRANNWYQVSPVSRPRSLNTFTDPPVVTHDRWGNTLLHCSHQVNRLGNFLRSNPDICFVVFHDYNRFQEARKSKSSCENEEFNQPTCDAKSIYPVSKELKGALEMILEDKTEYSGILSRYWAKNELAAPYLFIYHSRQEIQKIKERLSKPAQDQLDLFLEYVMKDLGEEYNAVDTLLQRKEILPQYLQYLVKKDDFLVENKNGEYTAYRAETWPVESMRTTPNPSIATKYSMPGNAYESRQELGISSKWILNGFTWGFDGSFFGQWKRLKLEMSLDVSSPGAVEDHAKTGQLQGQPITDLAVFPLRYAPEHIQKMLYHRGEILWKCRKRQLVSYQTNEQDLMGNGMEQHYMIDMKAYQRLHPNNEKTRIGTVYRPYSDAPKKLLSKKKIIRNNLPGDDFAVLMPPRIKGYNFYQNKWCDLNVDQISDVVWRGEAFPAFHTLQVDYEAKDLLHALVSYYLESAHSPDLDVGKCSSLILLLHGGPGTGKTHTAENIAEIAKKPLYRVTCSDLGTKAEVVEENLESALYLARIWGCVVLLDEADIFLEQTTLGDLERNALTAVFLRMVKSYDGIVIITSSRVSRFNEAVRSHINLALHYPALTSHQRYFIWKQFVSQLELSQTDADISDLYEQAESLGEKNLNGRQIRNIFTNACRYARWKKVPLNYYHIKHMIEVSERFGTFFGNRDGDDAQDELALDEWLH